MGERVAGASRGAACGPHVVDAVHGAGAEPGLVRCCAGPAAARAAGVVAALTAARAAPFFELPTAILAAVSPSFTAASAVSSAAVSSAFPPGAIPIALPSILPGPFAFTLAATVPSVISSAAIPSAVSSLAFSLASSLTSRLAVRLSPGVASAQLGCLVEGLYLYALRGWCGGSVGQLGSGVASV